MVTLATLMYEILLTRIFSVTMWYHFAFVALSIALFGMTVGALIVYLKPHLFPPARTPHHLALSALFFGISTVLSFLTHLSIPFIPSRSLIFVYGLALTYAVISVPFIFSGICVCLALTRYPSQVSTLYAADLLGAAAGSILVIAVLEITDAPTAILAVGFLAGVGAVCFAAETRDRRLGRAAWVACLVLGVFAAGHTALVARQSPLLRPVWVKGRIEPRPLYETWNSFSRIRVTGDPDAPEQPTGWGMSPAYPSHRPVRQLHMDIDAAASTVLTGFGGDPRDLEYLKYDVTNVAHYLRPGADVLVIGSGGGRDVLAALAFDQRSVLAIEVNQDIVDTVNRRFGAFTGHLDRLPNVVFVADEARSYVARHKKAFDIVQVSLIDSWAATAAGAYVLAEHSLYTLEAWTLFLGRLTPPGVLAVSRWYVEDRPDEMYRVTSLATAALRAVGVEEPRRHIAILRARPQVGPRRGSAVGVGTILIGRTPLSGADLDLLDDVAERMRFDVVLSPRSSLDATMLAIATTPDLEAFAAAYPMNIAPPTDDSPFFFHMIRLRDALHWKGLSRSGGGTQNSVAVIVLGALVLAVITLTAIGIVLPLVMATDRRALAGRWPLVVFFGSIGLGFMLVEISQMQRLIIFLGHPTFSLSVVLVTLLSASGLGSYLTVGVARVTAPGPAMRRLALLVLVLLVFGFLTPYATRAFQESATWVRILVSAATLVPPGLFMGMAFPLGMALASRSAPTLTPWLWGINGATSVCASVLAVTVALASSITAAFWSGVSAYGVGVVAYWWASWTSRPEAGVIGRGRRRSSRSQGS